MISGLQGLAYEGCEKRVAAVEYCTYDLKSDWPQRCIIYLQAGGQDGGISCHKTSITH